MEYMLTARKCLHVDSCRYLRRSLDRRWGASGIHYWEWCWSTRPCHRFQTMLASLKMEVLGEKVQIFYLFDMHISIKLISTTKLLPFKLCQ